MARRERSVKLDSPTARSRLERRHAPHWHALSKGLALGYRKGAKDGVWLGRRHDRISGFKKKTLGLADDRADADGATILSFDQAVEAARAWFAGPKRESTRRGPFTVEDAMKDYEADAIRRGVKDLKNFRSRRDVHILPELGKLVVSELTAKKLKDWHAQLAAKPRLARRNKLGVGGKAMKPRKDDPEEMRRRRSSANRILTVLKGALNHAFREGHVASDEAWRRVQPFKNADGVRLRFLSEDEATRLVAVCEPDFAALVRGALLTGARYSELARMTVVDVNLNAATVYVRESKSNKPRHISLSTAGVAHFKKILEGKAPRDRIFIRAEGREWRASDQRRPMEAAVAAAKIDPPITFHGLRDTHASALAMAGVPMKVIAEQLGHADTRTTEKHYAHLAPSARAAAVANHLPDLGA